MGDAVLGDPLLGFCAGLVLAVLTAPVGVSGAVFLLPFHLSILQVPSPAVTPTNLLYNVVSTPGALLRYRVQGQLGGPLLRALVAGTLPGVIVGAAVRVYLVPGVNAFRVVAAAVLLPLGLWLCVRSNQRNQPRRRSPTHGHLTALGAVAGVVGGVYGIGGGSLIGPVLAARGMSMSRVAPAALGTTLVTSVAGLGAYLLLSLSSTDAVGPEWAIGVSSGLGGLVGGYLGAWLQPSLPQRTLTLLLGGLAVGIALLYVVQSQG